MFIKNWVTQNGFLGLRTLTTIEETIKIVKDRHNKVITLSNIPLDDLNTFKLFCNAQTLGVFQLESPGMRDLLRKFKPQNIHDIMAVVALFRPGPMKIIDDYVKRRHGVIPVKYDHPL